MAGLVVLLCIGLIALCAELISPYSKGILQNSAARLQGPSAAHLFGTDVYGRDLFTRVIHGGRLSLSMALTAAISAMGIACCFGAAAAYFGGLLDELIMRIMDTMLCMPSILLSLAIVSALGPGLRNLTLALVISYIPGYTRLIRSAARSIVALDYIDAARICGQGELTIIHRHILRNIWGPIIVQATLSIGGIILHAAGLSFIGLGVQPPAPEWGAMLSEAREFLRRAPHLMVFPGSAIIITALSFNLLGDGLRDAMDTRLE